MFSSLFEDIISIIEEWRPKVFPREAQYRDDLITILRKELNKEGFFGPSEKYSIRKEAGRHLADIGVEGKVGIELKINLNTKSQVDRLFGQVDDYFKGYDSTIIVLCGKTSNDQLDYLEEKIRKAYPDDLFSSKQIKIIVKNRKQKKKENFSLLG